MRVDDSQDCEFVITKAEGQESSKRDKGGAAAVRDDAIGTVRRY